MGTQQTEQPRIKRYTDTWGGKNYSCYPLRIPGQSLKEKLDVSDLWELKKEEQHIDKRNDNQCDIHRGSDFTYQHCTTGSIINVFMNKSRSGKTINWEFHCYFEDEIYL